MSLGMSSWCSSILGGVGRLAGPAAEADFSDRRGAAGLGLVCGALETACGAGAVATAARGAGVAALGVPAAGAAGLGAGRRAQNKKPSSKRQSRIKMAQRSFRFMR